MCLCLCLSVCFFNERYVSPPTHSTHQLTTTQHSSSSSSSSSDAPALAAAALEEEAGGVWDSPQRVEAILSSLRAPGAFGGDQADGGAVECLAGGGKAAAEEVAKVGGWVGDEGFGFDLVGHERI